MKISGFQKTSLIDYPGKIVSIIFTQGCNFRCPYCYNSELIPSESEQNEYFPLDYIFECLKKRKGLIDGISITGGEPTLQADLYDFLIEVKQMNYKIKLDTNGSNPELLKVLITDKMIDYIAMDIKGPIERYKEITSSNINTSKIQESIKTIQNAGIDYEFRTTVVPGIHSYIDMKAISLLVKDSREFYIQNFRAENTYEQSLMKLNGYTPQKLEEFKDIIKPYVKYIKIRN